MTSQNPKRQPESFVMKDFVEKKLNLTMQCSKVARGSRTARVARPLALR
jgi:hypothetical protein